MTSNWKILAPIDLSRPAEEDVKHAVGVATVLGAGLHLLYVTDSECSGDVPQTWPPDSLSGKALEIPVSRVVLQGPVAATIAEYADSIDATLILMTSRRYGRWSRFWRKSVTDEVMRLSRRRVCITNNGIDTESRSRNYRILCVMGLDNRETALVQHAEDIAARAGAELVLLHVVPEPSEALLYHAVDGGSRPLSRKRAAGDLADIARSLRRPSITSVISGDADKCVGLAAQEHSADLVLLARGRPGLQATYENDLPGISRHLHCPLLTMPVDTAEPVQAVNEQPLRLRWPSVQPRVNTAVAALKRCLESGRPVYYASTRQGISQPRTVAWK
jgi:nucleotide-binding universal stress UspA family protein